MLPYLPFSSFLIPISNPLAMLFKGLEEFGKFRVVDSVKKVGHMVDIAFKLRSHGDLNGVMRRLGICFLIKQVMPS